MDSVPHRSRYGDGRVSKLLSLFDSAWYNHDDENERWRDGSIQSMGQDMEGGQEQKP